jgi:hypothetical protein
MTITITLRERERERELKKPSSFSMAKLE